MMVVLSYIQHRAVTIVSTKPMSLLAFVIVFKVENFHLLSITKVLVLLFLRTKTLPKGGVMS